MWHHFHSKGDINVTIKAYFSLIPRMNSLKHLIFGKCAYKAALMLEGTTLTTLFMFDLYHLIMSQKFQNDLCMRVYCICYYEVIKWAYLYIFIEQIYNILFNNNAMFYACTISLLYIHISFSIKCNLIFLSNISSFYIVMTVLYNII